ncbi:MAG TPA: GntR family transcriptional regulator [Phnomibacter sp.]|nr:GntR family transcriptional regulator [Phnomibacter sp.]
MKKPPIYQYLNFDYYSATPKYLQLANSVVKAIAEGRLKKDDPLPSINELSFEFEISRDTAEKGYKHLKQIGVLGSVPGKGYFIKCTDVEQQLKIFLLFNKLSFHKKLIYDAFVAALGNNAVVDLYVYNNDFALFKKLIQNRKEDYTHFVIIPHYTDGEDNTVEVLESLPLENVVVLDKMLPGLQGNFAAVYEPFDRDLLDTLEIALPQLQKYQTLKIVFPEDSYHPREIIRGFTQFCRQYAFNYKVVHNAATETIEKGDVYINLMEDDLVTLIERILAQHFVVGTDVGVISYNETPLKKIILNGLTTISTDFAQMGQTAARLLLTHSHEKVKNPFHLTLRSSL